MFIIVLLISWIAFLFTAMPGSDNPLRYFRAMYFAATLFIFGALDVGFPHSGPQFAIIALWICYFISPAFTISYVYKVIEDKIFNHLPFYLKKHTVFLGMGQNGVFIYETLKSKSPDKKIVIVDCDEKKSNIRLYEKASSVWWIKNNFENEKVLQKARIGKAKQVCITTNNDLVNLMAAFRCLKMNPSVERIYCHLQNYAMHEDFRKSLMLLPEYGKITFYNGYTFAAKEIHKMLNTADVSQKSMGRMIIFMGMGHFGLTLFDHLMSKGGLNEHDEIVVVSLKKKLIFDISAYDWCENNKLIKCKIHPPVYADIFHAETWNTINNIVKDKSKPVTMIHCLDNDESNINLAVQIKINGPAILRKAIIYCRTFKPVSENLEKVLEHSITQNESRDIITFSIETALKKAYGKEIAT